MKVSRLANAAGCAQPTPQSHFQHTPQTAASGASLRGSGQVFLMATCRRPLLSKSFINDATISQHLLETHHLAVTSGRRVLYHFDPVGHPDFFVRYQLLDLVLDVVGDLPTTGGVAGKREPITEFVAGADRHRRGL